MTFEIDRLSSIILSRLLLNLREASITSNSALETLTTNHSDLRFNSRIAEDVDTSTGCDLDADDEELLAEDQSVGIALDSHGDGNNQEAGPSCRPNSPSNTHSLITEIPRHCVVAEAYAPLRIEVA